MHAHRRLSGGTGYVLWSIGSHTTGGDLVNPVQLWPFNNRTPLPVGQRPPDRPATAEGRKRLSGTRTRMSAGEARFSFQVTDER